MIPGFRLFASAGAAVALSASLLIATAPAGAVPPQQPDSAGKDFWVAFPANFNNQPSLSVLITSRTATSGTVEIPGLASVQGFTTTPGTVTTITIPANAQLGSGASGNPEARAVHITADDEVAVQGLSRVSASSDGFTAMPVDALATEYTVLAWPAPGIVADVRSQFAVVATADGTEVTFVPKANTTSGVAAGSSQTVTLNKGDALPVTSGTGDLSGTTVTSTEPVAVLSGHGCGNVPNLQTPFCNYLIEQLPGDAAWGTSYLTVPLKTRQNGDTFRIVAKDDDTIVAINGSEVATLNKGQVHQQIITGQSLVTADKPILVAQYANGNNFDKVNGDPFMMLMTPTVQFGSDYSFTSAAGFTGYVNVVASDDAVGGVSLDGTPIPSGAFTPIGSTGFSGAQIDVPVGAHTLSALQPFGAYVYGFTNTPGPDAYGYPAGSRYVALREIAELTLTPSTQAVTVDTQACLTATATNGNGTGLPDLKLHLTATGVNPLDTTLTTDAQGGAKYCYSSSQAGTDTFTLSSGKAAATSGDQLSASATVQWEAAPTPPPTPTPTPTPTPAPERKVLPIKTKQVAKSPVSLGRDDKVVLVKSIGTNKRGEIAVRSFCRPVGTAAAGEVRFCDITVSKKGKVTLRSTGYDTLRVTVRVRAIPKPGERDAWRGSSWRETWRVRA